MYAVSTKTCSFISYGEVDYTTGYGSVLLFAGGYLVVRRGHAVHWRFSSSSPSPEVHTAGTRGTRRSSAWGACHAWECRPQPRVSIVASYPRMLVSIAADCGSYRVCGRVGGLDGGCGQFRLTECVVQYKPKVQYCFRRRSELLFIMAKFSSSLCKKRMMFAISRRSPERTGKRCSKKHVVHLDVFG